MILMQRGLELHKWILPLFPSIYLNDEFCIEIMILNKKLFTKQSLYLLIIYRLF